MEVWIEDGEIYCGDCKGPESDGPYLNGGGEADCPRHCGGCGTFLKNPLTPEGREYVKQRWLKADGTSNNHVLMQWYRYYGVEATFSEVLASIKDGLTWHRQRYKYAEDLYEAAELAQKGENLLRQQELVTDAVHNSNLDCIGGLLGEKIMQAYHKVG